VIGPAATARIAVVTPSCNRVAYLEHTLRWALDRGPGPRARAGRRRQQRRLRRFLERHADRFAGWVSEPDGGHAVPEYDAGPPIPLVRRIRVAHVEWLC
jgi:hypothetical protein